MSDKRQKRNQKFGSSRRNINKNPNKDHEEKESDNFLPQRGNELEREKKEIQSISEKPTSLLLQSALTTTAYTSQQMSASEPQPHSWSQDSKDLLADNEAMIKKRKMGSTRKNTRGYKGGGIPEDEPKNKGEDVSIAVQDHEMDNTGSGSPSHIHTSSASFAVEQIPETEDTSTAVQDHEMDNIGSGSPSHIHTSSASVAVEQIPETEDTSTAVQDHEMDNIGCGSPSHIHTSSASVAVEQIPETEDTSTAVQDHEMDNTGSGSPIHIHTSSASVAVEQIPETEVSSDIPVTAENKNKFGEENDVHLTDRSNISNQDNCIIEEDEKGTMTELKAVPTDSNNEDSGQYTCSGISSKTIELNMTVKIQTSVTDHTDFKEDSGHSKEDVEISNTQLHTEKQSKKKKRFGSARRPQAGHRPEESKWKGVDATDQPEHDEDERCSDKATHEDASSVLITELQSAVTEVSVGLTDTQLETEMAESRLTHEESEIIDMSPVILTDNTVHQIDIEIIKEGSVECIDQEQSGLEDKTSDELTCSDNQETPSVMTQITESFISVQDHDVESSEKGHPSQVHDASSTVTMENIFDTEDSSNVPVNAENEDIFGEEKDVHLTNASNISSSDNGVIEEGLKETMTELRVWTTPLTELPDFKNNSVDVREEVEISSTQLHTEKQGKKKKRIGSTRRPQSGHRPEESKWKGVDATDQPEHDETQLETEMAESRLAHEDSEIIDTTPVILTDNTVHQIDIEIIKQGSVECIDQEQSGLEDKTSDELTCSDNQETPSVMTQITESFISVQDHDLESSENGHPSQVHDASSTVTMENIFDTEDSSNVPVNAENEDMFGEEKDVHLTNTSNISSSDNGVIEEGLKETMTELRVWTTPLTELPDFKNNSVDVREDVEISSTQLHTEKQVKKKKRIGSTRRPQAGHRPEESKWKGVHATDQPEHDEDETQLETEMAESRLAHEDSEIIDTTPVILTDNTVHQIDIEIVKEASVECIDQEQSGLEYKTSDELTCSDNQETPSVMTQITESFISVQDHNLEVSENGRPSQVHAASSTVTMENIFDTEDSSDVSVNAENKDMFGEEKDVHLKNTSKISSSDNGVIEEGLKETMTELRVWTSPLTELPDFKNNSVDVTEDVEISNTQLHTEKQSKKKKRFGSTRRPQGGHRPEESKWRGVDATDQPEYDEDERCSDKATHDDVSSVLITELQSAVTEVSVGLTDTQLETEMAESRPTHEESEIIDMPPVILTDNTVHQIDIEIIKQGSLECIDQEQSGSEDKTSDELTCSDNQKISKFMEEVQNDEFTHIIPPQDTSTAVQDHEMDNTGSGSPIHIHTSSASVAVEQIPETEVSSDIPVTAENKNKFGEENDVHLTDRSNISNQDNCIIEEDEKGTMTELRAVPTDSNNEDSEQYTCSGISSKTIELNMTVKIQTSVTDHTDFKEDSGHSKEDVEISNTQLHTEKQSKNKKRFGSARRPQAGHRQEESKWKGVDATDQPEHDEDERCSDKATHEDASSVLITELQSAVTEVSVGLTDTQLETEMAESRLTHEESEIIDMSPVILTDNTVHQIDIEIIKQGSVECIDQEQSSLEDMMSNELTCSDNQETPSVMTQITESFISVQDHDVESSENECPSQVHDASSTVTMENIFDTEDSSNVPVNAENEDMFGEEKDVHLTNTSNISSSDNGVIEEGLKETMTELRVWTTPLTELPDFKNNSVDVREEVEISSTQLHTEKQGKKKKRIGSTRRPQAGHRPEESKWKGVDATNQPEHDETQLETEMAESRLAHEDSEIIDTTPVILTDNTVHQIDIEIVKEASVECIDQEQSGLEDMMSNELTCLDNQETPSIMTQITESFISVQDHDLESSENGHPSQVHDASSTVSMENIFDTEDRSNVPVNAENEDMFGEEKDVHLTNTSNISSSDNGVNEEGLKETMTELRVWTTPLTELPDFKNNSVDVREDVEISSTQLHTEKQSKKKKRIGSTRRPQAGHRPEESKWKGVHATDQPEHDEDERCSGKATHEDASSDLITELQSAVTEVSVGLTDAQLETEVAESRPTHEESEIIDMPPVILTDNTVHQIDIEIIKQGSLECIDQEQSGSEDKTSDELTCSDNQKISKFMEEDQNDEFTHVIPPQDASTAVQDHEMDNTGSGSPSHIHTSSASVAVEQIPETEVSSDIPVTAENKNKFGEENDVHLTDRSNISNQDNCIIEEDEKGTMTELRAVPTNSNNEDSEQYTYSGISSKTIELNMTVKIQTSVTDHTDFKEDSGHSKEDVEISNTQLHTEKQSKKKKRFGSTRRPQGGHRPEESKWKGVDATDQPEHDEDERCSDKATHEDPSSVLITELQSAVTEVSVGLTDTQLKTEMAESRLTHEESEIIDMPPVILTDNTVHQIDIEIIKDASVECIEQEQSGLEHKTSDELTCSDNQETPSVMTQITESFISVQDHDVKSSENGSPSQVHDASSTVTMEDIFGTEDSSDVPVNAENKDRFGEEKDVHLTNTSNISSSDNGVIEEKHKERMTEIRAVSTDSTNDDSEQYTHSGLFSQTSEMGLMVNLQESPLTEIPDFKNYSGDYREYVEISSTQLYTEKQSKKKKRFGSTRRPQAGHRPEESKLKGLDATDQPEYNEDETCSEETTHEEASSDLITELQSAVTEVSLGLTDKQLETEMAESIAEILSNKQIGPDFQADLAEQLPLDYSISKDRHDQSIMKEARSEPVDSSSAFIHTLESNACQDNLITENSKHSTSGKRRKMGSTRKSPRKQHHQGEVKNTIEDTNHETELKISQKENVHVTDRSHLSGPDNVVIEEDHKETITELRAVPTDSTNEDSEQTSQLTDSRDCKGDAEMRSTHLSPESQSMKKKRFGSKRRPQGQHRPEEWKSVNATDQPEHEEDESCSDETTYEEGTSDLFSEQSAVSKVSLGLTYSELEKGMTESKDDILGNTENSHELLAPRAEQLPRDYSISRDLLDQPVMKEARAEPVNSSSAFINTLESNTCQDNLITDNSKHSTSGKRRKMGSTRKSPREQLHRVDPQETNEETNEKENTNEHQLQQSSTVTEERNSVVETINFIPTEATHAETTHQCIEQHSNLSEFINMTVPDLETLDKKKRKMGSTRKNFKVGDGNNVWERTGDIRPRTGEDTYTEETRSIIMFNTVLHDTAFKSVITAETMRRDNELQIHHTLDPSEDSLLSEIESELKKCYESPPNNTALTSSEQISASPLKTMKYQENISEIPQPTVEKCKSALELPQSQSSQTHPETTSPGRRRKMGSTRKTPRDRNTEESDENRETELERGTLVLVKSVEPERENTMLRITEDTKESVEITFEIQAVSQVQETNTTLIEQPLPGEKRKFGSRRKCGRNFNEETPEALQPDQKETEDELVICEPKPECTSTSPPPSQHGSTKASTHTEQVEKSESDVSTEAGLVSLDDLRHSAPYNGITGRREKIDFEKWNEPITDFGVVVYNVVIVGNCNVGKTSFIKRFQNGHFSRDYSSTIGVDTCVHTFTLGNKTVKLNIWDTAGQERYHSITKQVFHKAQGLLLMYDITSYQSYCAVRNWISQIEERAPADVIMMLLGNKNDCAEREVQLQEGEALAKEYKINFLECSAATGQNVLESIKTLAWLLVKQKVRREEELTVLQPKPQKKSGCC
ncbi:uncharacterized protein rab44 [Hoplias malabaricus]|uniref:uncharacterized protein rab44 n=1 Tax=Hoplias malabaricus TaxID=27720 RepID=UPI003461F88E